MTTPLEPTAIASRLRRVAEEMAEIGAAMCGYGGWAEWSQHGQELLGAAQLARQWADAIDAEQSSDL